MAKKKQILFPVVFMVAITAVFTFILAFINDVTQPVIEEQKALEIQKSILFVFDIDYSDRTNDEITEFFNDIIQTDTVNSENYYTYKKDGAIMGYAVEISGKGLWGTISGHLAFSRDHQEILGVNFTAHSETPGLGGRIDELSFKNQFRSIQLNQAPFFSYGKGTGGNVDAISGATLTSLAVKDILNNTLPTILEKAREEGFYEGN
jgi:Na+-transporting NADH:ubiquinone oxidoreductase subunit C